jgi:hypothetical protein
MVGHTRLTGVDVSAAQIFGADLFTGRCFDERWAGEENRSVSFDNDRFIGHRWDVCPSRSAAAKDCGDLRDAFAGHHRLIPEDATKVADVRKNLVLHREEGSAAIDEIDTREIVDVGHILGADVFLDGHWIV